MASAKAAPTINVAVIKVTDDLDGFSVASDDRQATRLEATSSCGGTEGDSCGTSGNRVRTMCAVLSAM